MYEFEIGRLRILAFGRTFKEVPDRAFSIWIALLLVSIGAFAMALPVHGEPTKSVLILSSEDTNRPGIVLMNQAIRSTLQSGSSSRLQFFVEAQDNFRIPNEWYETEQVNLFRRKYERQKIDLIIAISTPALKFLLRHRSELFPDSPIVFCTLDKREVEGLSFTSAVTGVWGEIELSPTLDIALALHPDTENVVVVSGNSYMDKFWMDQAQKEFRQYEDRLKFTYLTDISLGELRGQLSRLNSNTIVLFLSFLKDSEGNNYTIPEAIASVANNVTVPMYGVTQVHLGTGAVGGWLLPNEALGKAAGTLGLRVLGGENASNISPQAISSVPMFDWRQLTRWGINEGKLPPGSIIQFHVPSLWEQYKLRIIGVISLCVLEAVLIVWLCAAIARRKRAEKAEKRSTLLAESEHQHLDEVVSNVPGIVWEARMKPGTQTPGTDFVSQYASKMLGYSVQEWLSTPDFWLSIIHPEDREQATRNSQAVFESGNDGAIQYRWLAKDGQVLWVETHLNAICDETGKAVGLRGVTMNITERKLAEDSLRALSGRLINAQEDERSRVARELHDDLNQRLALLSIELEGLGQKLATSPNGLRDRVLKLQSQAIDICSEVHRLSYQLHPAKLDHLGLAAALKSFCEEISAHQDLNIEFRHQGLPSTLPKDVTLCIFRIVQESLRNVLKHSDAHEAVVALERVADSLHLTISDTGSGFNVDSVSARKGLGLISMQERLRLVGGKIFINSAPGKGTEISIRVPLTTKN
jgi:PAS domain S-box-containing protein